MGYLGKQITITGTQNSKRLSVLATDGQTTFTVSNGYTIGQLDVYRNGVKLSRSRDFTASDGTSVVLVSAANANDIVEFVVFENFDVANAITTGGDQTITGALTVEGDFIAGTALTVTNGGVTAGILTAQSFHGDGANLTNVGVDTAQVSTSGLVVSGISTLAGATLSGISTATAGFDFKSTGEVRIGPSNQISISHNTSNGNITCDTGYQYIRGASGFRVQKEGSGFDDIIIANSDGAVELYYDDVKKFETDAGGVKITGVCTATSFSGSGSGLTGLNIPAGFNELDAALFN
jgi:hypothetical protein